MTSKHMHSTLFINLTTIIMKEFPVAMLYRGYNITSYTAWTSYQRHTGKYVMHICIAMNSHLSLKLTHDDRQCHHPRHGCYLVMKVLEIVYQMLPSAGEHVSNIAL